MTVPEEVTRDRSPSRVGRDLRRSPESFTPWFALLFRRIFRDESLEPPPAPVKERLSL
jgi:hypothetical protein